MTFERFERIGGIFKIKASVSTKGVISLNQGACNAYKLSPANAKFVELYYDKDEKLIGMKFVIEENGSVATVRHRKSSLDFSAKSMMDFYGIQPSKTSLYELKNENGMIILDLKTAVERKTKKED